MFLWNLPSDPHRTVELFGWRQFQSLFLWNLPSDRSARFEVRRKNNVSILVFVELALGHSSLLHLNRPMSVSILVFVELALGRGFPSSDVDPNCSFNPCFCGTCPRTLIASNAALNACGFQSLFLWNLPSDVPTELWNYLDGISFNPCFCGTCPRTFP